MEILGEIYTGTRFIKREGPGTDDEDLTWRDLPYYNSDKYSTGTSGIGVTETIGTRAATEQLALAGMQSDSPAGSYDSQSPTLQTAFASKSSNNSRNGNPEPWTPTGVVSVPPQQTPTNRSARVRTPQKALPSPPPPVGPADPMRIPPTHGSVSAILIAHRGGCSTVDRTPAGPKILAYSTSPLEEYEVRRQVASMATLMECAGDGEMVSKKRGGGGRNATRNAKNGVTIAETAVDKDQNQRLMAAFSHIATNGPRQSSDYQTIPGYRTNPNANILVASAQAGPTGGRGTWGRRGPAPRGSAQEITHGRTAVGGAQEKDEGKELSAMPLDSWVIEEAQLADRLGSRTNLGATIPTGAARSDPRGGMGVPSKQAKTMKGNTGTGVTITRKAAVPQGQGQGTAVLDPGISELAHGRSIYQSGFQTSPETATPAKATTMDPPGGWGMPSKRRKKVGRNDPGIGPSPPHEITRGISRGKAETGEVHKPCPTMMDSVPSPVLPLVVQTAEPAQPTDHQGAPARPQMVSGSVGGSPAVAAPTQVLRRWRVERTIPMLPGTVAADKKFPQDPGASKTMMGLSGTAQQAIGKGAADQASHTGMENLRVAATYHTPVDEHARPSEPSRREAQKNSKKNSRKHRRELQRDVQEAVESSISTHQFATPNPNLTGRPILRWHLPSKNIPAPTRPTIPLHFSDILIIEHLEQVAITYLITALERVGGQDLDAEIFNGILRRSFLLVRQMMVEDPMMDITAEGCEEVVVKAVEEWRAGLMNGY